MKKQYTCLADGNAVAYTINIGNCNDEEDFCRKFLERLRDYSRSLHTMNRVIIFFDDKVGGTWRDALYSEYQAGRKAAKENYTPEQLAEAKLRSKYIRYLRDKIDNSEKFCYLSYPHTETDDLVSLYCNNIQEEGETVTILTTDKDLFQLINEDENHRVQILFLIKRKLVKDKEQGKQALLDKIWLGDNSDSIPNVCKNVGKSNIEDLQKFVAMLKEHKEENYDITDVNKMKKVCESLNLRYIPSFSNFNQEQLNLNTKLIDLKYVVELDEKENNIKTDYLRENVKKAKISPFALYSFK